MCWPIQQKYLGRCLGWYTVIEGSLNRVVHLWGYDSQSDREERRKKMAADPEFHAYLKAVAEADVLLEMENSIVAPTSFYAALAGR
jgi:nucleosome binding factor SPN SPT16 subunit